MPSSSSLPSVLESTSPANHLACISQPASATLRDRLSENGLPLRELGSSFTIPGATIGGNPYASHLREPETIRIFYLDGPADSFMSSPITGSLKTVSLKEPPPFVALSYVWGDYATPCDAIYCDGFPIEVTKNSISALRHLRKNIGKLAIWIDIICINQADDNEKMLQIPLMAQIYTRAETVYAWLGEGTQETDKAMDYLSKGGLPFDVFIRENIGDGIVSIPTGIRMAFRLACHLNIRAIIYCLSPSRAIPHRIGLKDILERPWISRLWTLQEALVSDNLVIVCGQRMVPWYAMIYAIEYMLDLGGMYKHPLSIIHIINPWRILSSSWRQYHENISTSYETRLGSSVSQKSQIFIPQLRQHKNYLRWGINISLPLLAGEMITIWLSLFVTILQPAWGRQVAFYATYPFICLMLLFGLYFNISRPSTWKRPHAFKESVVIEIIRRQASDARDKYYAVASLIQPLFSGVTDQLPDDSVERVYATLFTKLLTYTESLDMLLFVSGKTAIPDFPSWVVDWRNVSQYLINARYFVADSKTFWLETRFSQMWLLLVAYRVFCGMVAQLFSRATSNDGKISRRGATPGSQTFWRIMNGEHLSEARLVVRGLAIDRIAWSSGEIGEISSPPTEAQLMEGVRIVQDAFVIPESPVPIRMEMWLVGAMDFIHDTSRGVRFDQSLLSLEENLWVFRVLRQWGHLRYENIWMINFLAKERMPLVRIINFLAKERMAFVRCVDGKAGLGICPNNVREGDRIFLISGVSLPMILREQELGYKVVGPAIFPEIMDGEAWNGGDLENLDEILLL